VLDRNIGDAYFKRRGLFSRSSTPLWRAIDQCLGSVSISRAEGTDAMPAVWNFLVSVARRS